MDAAIGGNDVDDGTTDNSVVTGIDIGIVVEIGVGRDCDGNDEQRVTEAEGMATT